MALVVEPIENKVCVGCGIVLPDFFGAIAFENITFAVSASKQPCLALPIWCDQPQRIGQTLYFCSREVSFFLSENQ